MKRIRDIISIILSIIILTNSILFYTTVWASTKLPSTSISIIKVQNQAFTVKWKKKTNIAGYQIQYSTNSKFKKENKSIKIKSAKTVSKKITKLKSNKKYYVRIRTYKGKKYSKWSTVKSAKISKESKSNKDNIHKEMHCTNNNDHSISCGNMGKWFNNKDEVRAYWDEVDIGYFQQYQNGTITFKEYGEKSPCGYECWSCSYCGKWTGNFKYN